MAPLVPVHRPLLGFLLSLVTVTCWGLLPIALKVVLVHLPPQTISFWRFFASGLVVAAALARQGELPRPWAAGGRVGGTFLVCVAGLVGNYVIYVHGLEHLAPGTAQLVIQLAPVTTMLGSLVLFGERFTGLQWGGVAVFFTGFGLFFHDRLGELATGTGAHALGVGLVALAALSWSVYGLAQKALLRRFRSAQVLVVVYLGGALALAPYAAPGRLLELGPVPLGALTFGCLNTLLAYGALAEAMAVWEGARVSAVLTITPVATVAFSLVAVAVLPGSVELPPLGPGHLAGGLLVVLGAMATALGKARYLAREARAEVVRSPRSSPDSPGSGAGSR